MFGIVFVVQTEEKLKETTQRPFFALFMIDALVAKFIMIMTGFYDDPVVPHYTREDIS